jgi:hypothetical protein
MIRVRRIGRALPPFRTYELEFAPDATSPAIERLTARRGAAVKRLERALGVGDAWSFIDAADRAWNEGSTTWAVEFEERSH